jgi:hypothetical protein
MDSVDPTGTEPQPPPAANNLGNVAPYNKQPSAVKNSAGARLTESEHVIHRAGLTAVTSDASTGTSDYTDRCYRNDVTVRIERDTALYKTHAGRGGPTADNARARTLKAGSQNGQPINYRDDVFMASLENAQKAARDTNSCVAAGKFAEAALAQDSNLFALQTAAQSGRILADRGHSLAADPDTLEFDLTGDVPWSSSGPAHPVPPPSDPVSLITPAGALEKVGYAAFVYQLSTAASPTEAVTVTASAATSYMGAEVGAALCGPPCAVIGAAVPEIAEDPVGFTEGTVDCVFGGHCGDIFGAITDRVFKPIDITDLPRQSHRR